MEEQTQITETKKINYRMPGNHILLFSPTKTKGGIELLAGSKTTEDFTVAKVGMTCKDTKVGDRVIMYGDASLLNIDGLDYWQIHESQIVGYVENDGVVTKGTPPAYAPADPTAHYNQNR